VDNFSPLLEPAVCTDCPAPARERRGNRGPHPRRCSACTRKASTAAAVARSAHHAAAPERKACDCGRASARYYRNNSRTPIPAA